MSSKKQQISSRRTAQSFDIKASETKQEKNKALLQKEALFKWTMLAEDYIFWDSAFRKQYLSAFIEETVKKLNYYSEMDWDGVLKKDHNHKIDIQNTTCKDKFENLIKCKKNSKNPIEEKDFYQLFIDQKHRLIGYRNSGVFYIFMNDPNHKVYPY